MTNVLLKALGLIEYQVKIEKHFISAISLAKEYICLPIEFAINSECFMLSVDHQCLSINQIQNYNRRRIDNR